MSRPKLYHPSSHSILKNSIRPIYCACAMLYYCCDFDSFLPSFSYEKKKKFRLRTSFPNNPHTNLHLPSPKTSSAHSRKPVKPTKHAKPKSPQSAPATPPDAARPVFVRPVVSNATNVNSSLLPKTSRKMTTRRTKRSRPNHARTDPRLKTRVPHQLSPAATPRTRR